MLISIITPTIGSIYFNRLLSSINRQYALNDLFKIEHLICIDDAPNNGNKVMETLITTPAVDGIERFIFNMPYSTGRNNYNGHKIYASISQLVNGDFTIFMDDDNMMDGNLIYLYLKNIGHLDWMYSLRKIIDENDAVVCNDECESLGYLSYTFYGGGESYLIDTNCYFVRSDILKSISSVWNRPANYNINDFSNVLPSQLNYEGTGLSNRTIEEILINRTNPLWLGEVVDWIKFINLYTSKSKINIFHWTSDNRIFNKESDFIDYKKFIVVMDEPKSTGIITYLSLPKFHNNKKIAKIIQETNGVIDDCHFGEYGHKVQSDFFYEHIKENI